LLPSYRREIVMPVVRYIVWVSTSLFAGLLIANWFLPSPPREVAHEAVDAPVIRIASAEHQPESVFIDTNQPRIVPPPTPLNSVVPDAASPLQSYASVEPSPATIDVGQKKRKEVKKRAKVAAYQSTSARPPAIVVPLTKLSLLEIVSGMGKRVFNLVEP
jgi:hypothetical protein